MCHTDIDKVVITHDYIVYIYRRPPLLLLPLEDPLLDDPELLEDELPLLEEPEELLLGVEYVEPLDVELLVVELLLEGVSYVPELLLLLPESDEERW
jgi:hypothetical protein